MNPHDYQTLSHTVSEQEGQTVVRQTEARVPARWFGSIGERITAMWATAVVASVFLMMNPLMPASTWSVMPKKRVVGSGVANCPNAPHTPGGPDSWGGCWPAAFNTGYPQGLANDTRTPVTLTNYTGPCLIQTNGTVIDSKSVTSCDELRIYAQNVVITNSYVAAPIYVDFTANEGSVTVTDTSIFAGSDPQWPNTGLGDAFFTATRVHVTGGTQSMNCYAYCTVNDSFLTGQMEDPTGVHHESAVRLNTNSTLNHNSLGCTAGNYPPDGGCSAAITGYPDFDPVSGNTVDKNLIMANISAGYCAYGGSTAGKAFSGQEHDIHWTNNVWQRGQVSSFDNQAHCGYWGPINAFDTTKPGAVWSNNKYDDGTTVAPAL